MMQLFGDYLEEANGEKLPAHLNLCACLLRLGRHAEAVDQANRALGVDPTCAKALYRRGRARQAMGQDEDARNDLVRAMECSPGGEDAAVLRAPSDPEKAGLSLSVAVAYAKDRNSPLPGQAQAARWPWRRRTGWTGGRCPPAAPDQTQTQTQSVRSTPKLV